MTYALELLQNIGLGLSTALQPEALIYCALGVTLGTLIGVIPGVGAITAISMLMPFTFYLDPTTAMIMLAGIYYGSAYGGSTSAILVNVPGSPSSAVTALDGYQMAKQGRGGVALFLTATSSFIGGSMGILLMMLSSPIIASVAMEFGSTEYFALILLGLLGAAAMSAVPLAKSVAAVALGVLFGLVGMDMYSGVPRLNFGAMELFEGISLVAVAMGLFGITELVASVGEVKQGEVSKITLRSMIPSRDELRRSWGPTVRGSAIGCVLGCLPGAGATVSSFLAYAVERKVSKDPSRFGQGAVEGVCTPEAANNAADQTGFIPTMTLGIPGSATMAVMIGVLMIHGITPGPKLIIEMPDLFWGLVMSFWVGNILLLILNIPMIGVWLRLLQIPYHYLYPSILLFICVGVYSVQSQTFDVWLVLLFGVLGYGMRLLGYPVAPLLLGFILGPMLEEHFRRAMIQLDGDLLGFVQRPISGSILFIVALILGWSAWGKLRESRQQRQTPPVEESSESAGVSSV